MATTTENRAAFRCHSCGHLHAAAHAGECAAPHACVVCGAGVRFDARGNKTLDPANWEVLADSTPERLAELGLTPDDVEAHEPDLAASHAENLRRCEESRDVLLAKKTLWESKPPEEWQNELDALHDRHDGLLQKSVSDADLGRHEDAKSAAKQKVNELLDCEWSQRDEEHLAELGKAIARQGRPPGRAPQGRAAGLTDRPAGRQFGASY